MISLTKKQVKCISPKVVIYRLAAGVSLNVIVESMKVLMLRLRYVFKLQVHLKVTYWNELINTS